MNVNRWGVPLGTRKLCDGVLLVASAAGSGLVLSEERNRLVAEPVRRADGCYDIGLEWAAAWVSLRKADVIGDDVTMKGRTARELDVLAAGIVALRMPAYRELLSGQLPAMEDGLRSGQPRQPAAPEGIITPDEAWHIASQWGSYVNGADPGAVFYSFPGGDARPRDPEHRRALIAYTETCLSVATARRAEYEDLAPADRDAWAWGDPCEDLEELQKLKAFFMHSETAPEVEFETPGF